MKKLYTFIFIFLSLIMYAQNTATIQVNTTKACNEPFDKDLTVQLFKLINKDTILVAAKMGTNISFENVDTSLKYHLKLSTNDTTESKINMKDLHQMANYIFGIDVFTDITNIISDIRYDGGLSTLDLLVLSRSFIGFSPLKINTWHFYEKSLKIERDPNILTQVSIFYIKKLQTGINEFIFEAIQRGKSSTLSKGHCTNCDNDTTNTFEILGPTQYFLKNTSYRIPLKYFSNKKIFTYLFSIKYNNIASPKIDFSGTRSSVFNHIAKDSIINFANFYPNVVETAVAFITFTPSKDGTFDDFFKLTNNFEHQATYAEYNCIKTINKVKSAIETKCSITWPKDITIPDCDLSSYLTGTPEEQGACKNNITYNFTDSKVDLSNGTNQCIISRKWTSVDKNTGEISTHTQSIKSNQNLKNICSRFVVELPSTLNVTSLNARFCMKSQISSHLYSFSPISPLDSIRTINSTPSIEQLYIYDLTDNSFCIAEITKTIASADCKIVWPKDYQTDDCSSISTNSGQPSWFGPCIHGLKITYIDKVTALPAPLISKTDRTWTVLDTTTKQVFQKLQSIICTQKIAELNPFEFFCYDSDLTKDNEHTLPIFSSNFKNILGLQGAFRFKDVSLKSPKKNILQDIEFNQRASDIRFIWIYNRNTTNTFSPRDTLFSLQLSPTKNLKISESIFLANDLLNSFAILGDFSESKAALTFKVFERSVPTKDFYKQNINLYPNPCSGEKIYLTTDFDSEANVSIYNTKGERFLESEIQLSNGSNSIDVPKNMAPGMYVLKIRNNTTTWFKKLIIAE
jgi:hypothetical protein